MCPPDIGEGKIVSKPPLLLPLSKRMSLKIQPIRRATFPGDDHLHRMIHVRSQPGHAILIGDRLGGQVRDGIEFLKGRPGKMKMNRSHPHQRPGNRAMGQAVPDGNGHRSKG